MLRLLIVSVILALASAAAADPRFIYLRDDNTSTMSGSLTDLQRLRKTLKPRALWFETASGKQFVIRDTAVLDQFEKLWVAAEALGEEMGTLGSKMGLIGARQGAVGAKQGVLGMRQGTLSSKQANLESREAEARTDAEREAIAKKRRAIEATLRELEQKMRVLEQQMRELEKPMKELEREMQGMQKKHDAATKQAMTDSEQLFARAVASGVAKPI